MCRDDVPNIGTVSTYVDIFVWRGAVGLALASLIAFFLIPVSDRAGRAHGLLIIWVLGVVIIAVSVASGGHFSDGNV